MQLKKIRTLRCCSKFRYSSALPYFILLYFEKLMNHLYIFKFTLVRLARTSPFLMLSDILLNLPITKKFTTKMKQQTFPYQKIMYQRNVMDGKILFDLVKNELEKNKRKSSFLSSKFKTFFNHIVKFQSNGCFNFKKFPIRVS